ncbi:hypothetical protein AAG906_028256 [Vitis piasezkii]
MLSSGCDAHECVLLPEGVRIGERATCPSLGSPDGVAPDSEARHVSSKKSIYDEPPSLGIPRQRVFSATARLAFCVSSSVSEVLGFWLFRGFDHVLGALGFHCPSRLLWANLILVCGRAKGQHHLLHQGAIQSGSVPLPSLFKEFLHVTRIPPAYIHPNMVRVLMGCSILSMLFNLDLSLLEVLFIYSIKKGKNDIYSFVASLPSLQLVTSLPDSTKGAARGHVLALGMNKLLLVLPWLRVSHRSSAQENHPKGSETEMIEDNPTDPVLVPDEGSPEEIQSTVNDGGPEPGEESHPSASSGGSPPFQLCGVGRDVKTDSIRLRCCCAFNENV